MKRSTDGGLTWSERLPVPESWATSREVPTIHRVVDPQGVKRLIMWSGLYPARLAVSEDDGRRWSPLAPAGEWGGIVVMGTLFGLETGPGHYAAMFHDDGRFFAAEDRRALPGGVHALPDPLDRRRADLVVSRGGARPHRRAPVRARASSALPTDGSSRCSCGRTPGGRTPTSSSPTTRGEPGATPRELPDTLNGDRHTARYGPDGRLFISFRSVSPKGKEAPFEGDWVGWVGRYEDLVEGRPGQYHVRLMDNHVKADCAYPGVEVLPDGTFVTTTYGHWTPGEEPYVVSIRLTMEELDALAAR